MTKYLTVERELLERIEAWVQDDCQALDELQALLAAPQPDGADVEVVAVLMLGDIDSGEYGDNDIETDNSIVERLQVEKVTGCDPYFMDLMTVEQHRRILAGVNRQAGSGWIACADRMPDVGKVLAFGPCTTDLGMMLMRDVAHHDGEKWCDFHGSSYIAKGEWRITHWQPLPPSPAAKAVQS